MPQSNYNKYRSKILAEIRKQKKLGLEIELELPLTEKQLRQKGIRGQELRKETIRLKNMLPEMRNVSRETLQRNKEEKAYYDSLFERNAQQIQERINNRTRTTYKARTQTGETKEVAEEDLPEEGSIIFDNIMDQFLAMISARPDKPLWDNRQPSYLRVEYWYQIHSAVMDLIESVGKSELGYRLKQNLPEFSESVNVWYQDSSQSAVYNACIEILTALYDGTISPQVRKDASMLIEDEQGFEDYG